MLYSVYGGSLKDKPTFLFTVLERFFYSRNLSESKFSSVEHIHRYLVKVMDFFFKDLNN